jgi:hypothetical protein
MSRSLSVGAVLRRTLGVYATQAPALLVAALLLASVLALDQTRPARTTALALVAALLDLLALGLFIGVVVLMAADVWDGRTRRGVGELLRGAWSALGQLLVTGAVAILAITLVTSIGSVILIGVIAGILLGSKVGVEAVILAALAFPVVVLVPELFLLTIWSVVAAVAVLERPRGLRALGRSRELVRGNGWRVLALVLTLTLPLTLIVSAIGGAAQAAGGEATVVIRLLLATVVAPIPVLAVTALYYELRQAEPTPPGRRPYPLPRRWCLDPLARRTNGLAAMPFT